MAGKTSKDRSLGQAKKTACLSAKYRNVYPVARRVEQVLDTSNRRDLSYPRIHHRPGGFCPRNRDNTRIPRPSNYPDALIASPLRVHGARKRGRDAEEDWGKGLERTSSAIHGSHLQLGRVPSASL